MLGVLFLWLSEVLHYWCAQDPTLSPGFVVCHVMSCTSPRVCVCANHTRALWLHVSHRSATCQHLHITGSSVGESTAFLFCADHLGRLASHTSSYGKPLVCLRRYLFYTEESPGPWCCFHLLRDCDLALSACSVEFGEALRVRVLTHTVSECLTLSDGPSALSFVSWILYSRQNGLLDTNTAAHDQ